MKGINVSIEGKIIFDSFDCSIPTEETTAIIGPGGSGKSTLLKILDHHFSGAEVSFGVEGSIDSNIQKSSFLPQKNVAKIFPSKKFQSQGKKLWCFSEDASLYFLEGLAAENPDGTQKKMLALTQALCEDPELLLLDEPTFGMPAKVRNWISDLLFMEKSKRTILVVTHNISFARKISDFTILIMDGVILEEGASSFLLSRPTTEIARSIVNGGLS